jgi:hypothetical protein
MLPVLAESPGRSSKRLLEEAQTSMQAEAPLTRPDRRRSLLRHITRASESRPRALRTGSRAYYRSRLGPSRSGERGGGGDVPYPRSPGWQRARTARRAASPGEASRVGR